MHRDTLLPVGTVVLTGAEFDVLERVDSPGLRLHDEHCSAAEAAICCFASPGGTAEHPALQARPRGGPGLRSIRAGG